MIKIGNPLIQQALLASVFLFAALGFGLIAEHKGLMGDNSLFSGGATGMAVTAQENKYQPSGGLISAYCDSIRGWACDKDKPDKQVKAIVWDKARNLPVVEVDAVSAISGSENANTICGLSQVGHAFEIIGIPNTLKDNQQHELELYVSDSDNLGSLTIDPNDAKKGYKLVGSKQIGPCTPPAGTPQNNNNPRGGILTADCSMIKGWACDKDKPDKQLKVLLWDGEAQTYQEIAVVDAASAIAGSENANTVCGLSTTGHAFELITIPNKLKDNKVHNIELYASDSDSSGNLYTDQNDPKKGYKLAGSKTLGPCSASGTPAQPGTDEYLVGGRFGMQAGQAYDQKEPCKFIDGWACDKDNYNKPIIVQVYEGDTRLEGNIQANLPYDDTNQYIGKGDLDCGGIKEHGFRWQIPASLKDGKAHTLKVLAWNIDSKGEFSNAKGETFQLGAYSQEGYNIVTVQCGTGSPAATDTNNPVGYVGIRGCDMIDGFACDKDNPNQRLQIDIYDELKEDTNKKPTHIGTIEATEPRYEWDTGATTMCGSKLVGFKWKIPDNLKDQPTKHRIRAYAINVNSAGERVDTRTDNLLPHTILTKYDANPLEFTCEAPAVPVTDTSNPIGAITKVDCTGVYGWACDKDKPAAQVNVWLNPSVLGAGTYDKYVKADSSLADTSPSAASAACGDSTAHGFYVPLSQVMDDGKTATIRLNGENIDSQGSVAKRGQAHAYLAIDAAGKAAGPCTTPTNTYDPKGSATVQAGPSYLDTATNKFKSDPCKFITGWTCDDDKGNKPLSIEISEGATVLAQNIEANLLWDDSNQYGGKRDSNCIGNMVGYRWEVPASLKDGAQHTIKVMASDINSAGDKTGTKKALYTNLPDQRNYVNIQCGTGSPAATDTNNPVGYVGIRGCDMIDGFACDKDNVYQRLEIDLYDELKLTGGKPTYVATIPVTDARYEWNQGATDQCSGHRQIAFKWKIPDTFKDGDTHRIRAYAINVKSDGTRNDYRDNVLVNKILPSYSPSMQFRCQAAATPPPTAPPGTASFVIRAKGSKSGNEWPKMNVRINGNPVNDFDVTSESYQDYTFTAAYNIGEEVDILYLNDGANSAAGTDRNLWIESVQIGDRIVRPSDDAVVYDKGDTIAESLDGRGVVSAEQWRNLGYVMAWNGAFRIDSREGIRENLPVGDVTLADCGTLRGWACDKDSPESRISIQVWEGNTMLMSFPASSNSAGTETHNAQSRCGSNDANHGFDQTTLPRSLYDSGPHRLKVFATNVDNTGKPRSNDPDSGRVLIKSIDIPNCPTRARTGTDSAKPNGAVLYSGCGMGSGEWALIGWACDPDKDTGERSGLQIDVWETDLKDSAGRTVDDMHLGSAYASSPGTTLTQPEQQQVGIQSLSADPSCPNSDPSGHLWFFPMPEAFKDGHAHKAKIYAINIDSNGDRGDPDYADTVNWGNKRLDVKTINCPITAPSTGTIKIRAKGDAAMGTWPEMVLKVNNIEKGRWFVDSNSFKEFTADISGYQPGQEISIAFTNDLALVLVDRNLYIQNINVQGSILQPDNPRIVYDLGDGTKAYDGEKLATAKQRAQAGYGAMLSNGALRIDAGLSQPAGGLRTEPPRSDSCQGICGQRAEQGCFCDAQCVVAGDCCDDYGDICNVGVSVTE
ncbi:hypothetical protein HYY74_03960 [Candidatus Woesearchaeota archaeon]|nr:hypothetical protein [Candidatus Woesearchaeota archaeon]